MRERQMIVIRDKESGRPKRLIVFSRIWPMTEEKYLELQEHIAWLTSDPDPDPWDGEVAISYFLNGREFRKELSRDPAAAKELCDRMYEEIHDARRQVGISQQAGF